MGDIPGALLRVPPRRAAQGARVSLLRSVGVRLDRQLASAERPAAREVTTSRRAPAMVIVHHLNNSRSQRVLWLLEELGVDYEVKRYERDAKTMLAPPELRAVHPLGKSPVITDGESDAGRVGGDRRVPRRSLRRRAAGSACRDARAPALHVLAPLRGGLDDAAAAAEAGLHPDARRPRCRRCVRPFVRRIADGVRTAVRRAADQAAPGLPRRESSAKTAWFAGDEFTAADIQMSFPDRRRAASRGGLDASRPKLFAFLDRIHARPAYQRALERGGPYALMS